jgi:hypothetical protein
MQARRIGGNADEVARGLRERLAGLEPVTAAEFEAVLQALRRNGAPRLAHQIVSDLVTLASAPERPEVLRRVLALDQEVAQEAAADAASALGPSVLGALHELVRAPADARPVAVRHLGGAAAVPGERGAGVPERGDGRAVRGVLRGGGADRARLGRAVRERGGADGAPRGADRGVDAAIRHGDGGRVGGATHRGGSRVRARGHGREHRTVLAA